VANNPHEQLLFFRAKTNSSATIIEKWRLNVNVTSAYLTEDCANKSSLESVEKVFDWSNRQHGALPRVPLASHPALRHHTKLGKQGFRHCALTARLASGTLALQSAAAAI